MPERLRNERDRCALDEHEAPCISRLLLPAGLRASAQRPARTGQAVLVRPKRATTDMKASVMTSPSWRGQDADPRGARISVARARTFAADGNGMAGDAMSGLILRRRQGGYQGRRRACRHSIASPARQGATSYRPAWRLSHTGAATAPHRQISLHIEDGERLAAILWGCGWRWRCVYFHRGRRTMVES